MKAHELLTDRNNWATDGLAYDAFGELLDSGDDERAVRWCALGAIEHCYHDRKAFNEACVRLRSFCLEKYDAEPEDVNDDGGYEMILGVLRQLDI